jgi:hypothetical protein
MDSTLPLPLSAPDERGGTGQTALEQLWRSRLKVIASNLENGEEEYREIANLADHIGRDYHGRFLIELLQNASDQATRAGVELSRATIVRTRSLVGVCNEGKPFDHSGLKEITSLGISHKEAAIHIGNKGVGFKAVYQVTGSPEIFSASSRVSSCHPRESLATSLETSIQLSTQPFENEELMGFLNRVGQDCVSTHAGATQSLTIDRLMEAVREAAPFKFPLPLPPSALKDRVVALGLTTEDLQRAQTLVVLPLLDDPGTQAAVERAINELSSADEESPGSLLLFLSGIGELIIRDLVRDRTIRVTRSKRFNETQLSRGRELYRVTTSVMESAASSNSKPRTRTWIAVSRSIGSAADGVDANAERMALQQAASTLPGKGWDDISVTTVTVALPIAPNAASGSRRLSRQVLLHG